MKEYIVQAYEQKTIDTLDAHNAQEIVRCKDCKHKDGCDPFLLFGNDEWFCADGEPKEQT